MTSLVCAIRYYYKEDIFQTLGHLIDTNQQESKKDLEDNVHKHDEKSLLTKRRYETSDGKIMFSFSALSNR